MNYSKYLESKRWKTIRKRVLKRDGRKCRSCGGRASVVHHGSYDAATMSGGRLDQLFSLCHACHEAVSLNVFGFKRDFAEQREWSKALNEKPVRERKAHVKKIRGGTMSMDEIRARSLEYAEGRMREERGGDWN